MFSGPQPIGSPQSNLPPPELAISLPFPFPFPAPLGTRTPRSNSAGPLPYTTLLSVSDRCASLSQNGVRLPPPASSPSSSPPAQTSPAPSTASAKNNTSPNNLVISATLPAHLVVVVVVVVFARQGDKFLGPAARAGAMTAGMTAGTTPWGDLVVSVTEETG